MDIRLEQLTMNFDGVTAVDQLNVTIPEGALVSMLGPSGCGKSTTLFMMAGLYKPTSGDLYFGDQRVTNLSPEKREIGMVFQNYALYPHLTVLKNIQFPLKMAKVPKKEAEYRAKEMAELVQIEHLLDRKPKQLSGGQQQRVAIARALVKNPKLLLLDEPLSNLDARLRLEMREEIRRIQKEVGITTVFVTHDQEEALSISDNILLLKDGKFQQYDDPQTIYDQPNNQFVAQFLGSPPINLLQAKVIDKGHVQLDVTGDVIVVQKEFNQKIQPNQEVIVGVRPEHLIIESDPSKRGIRGKAVMVERIGRDHLLHVLIGHEKIRAFVSPEWSIQEGDELTLSVQPRRVHIFHAQNGEKI